MKKIVKRKKNRINQGFSLVEVLLAVVLLAIVMVPLLQAILSSISINAKSRELMAATDCAQTVLEHLEGMKHDEIKEMFAKSSVSVPFLKDPDGNSYSGSGVSLGTLNPVSQCFSTSFSNFNSAPKDKRVYYSEMNDFYAFSNVNYSKGYFFDVVVDMDLAPNNVSTDKYHIYTVTVRVYKTDYRSATSHSTNSCLVTLNGSTYNSFEYY